MATTKGQVTIPKAMCDASGIRPGDRVEVTATAGGAVLIAKVAGDDARHAGARAKLDAAVADLHRRGIRPTLSADGTLALTRGED